MQRLAQSLVLVVGFLPINVRKLQSTSWRTLTNSNSRMTLGGHWVPSGCLPRRRVAVIVPYRDRERHLRTFLAHTLPILQRQLVEYRVFVIEQVCYTYNITHFINLYHVTCTIRSQCIYDSQKPHIYTYYV